MMFAKAYMQIFGDLETMTRMSSKFMRAASLGTAADGLMRTLPPQAQEMLERVATSIGSALKPADGNGHESHGEASAKPAEPAAPPADVTHVDVEPVREDKPKRR